MITSRLRSLLIAAQRLDARVRRLAESLPAEPADAIPALVRGRLECIAQDRLLHAIRDLEAAIVEAQEASQP